MNKDASWNGQLKIMNECGASKGYIWMEKKEEEKVDAALAIDPDNYQLICAKGILNFNYNWDVAINCFSKALAQRPFDSNQYYNRGRKYLSKNLVHEALSDLVMAVRIDTEDNWKWHYVGVALYLQRKYKEAIKYFHLALETAARYDNDLISCEADWLWTAYMHLGDRENAEAIINTIDKNTLVVPVIGDDDGYKNVCLLLNGIMPLDEFMDKVGPENEGGSVNELYGVAKYYYYLKNDLKTALEYLHKTLTFTSKSGAWGYKMAEMDKEDWEAEYAAQQAGK